MVDIHTELMRLSRLEWLTAHLGNHEVVAKPLDEIIGLQAIEVFYYTIVIHDLELAGREDAGEEVVERFFAIYRATIVTHILAHLSSRCSTVVAVGDVSAWHFLSEVVRDACNLCIVVNNPEDVTHT